MNCPICHYEGNISEFSQAMSILDKVLWSTIVTPIGAAIMSKKAEKVLICPKCKTKLS